MNLSVAGCGFQAVEDIAEILMEIILKNEPDSSFSVLRLQIARNTAGRCSSIKSRAMSGCVRNCLNVASWGVGVLLFFFINPGSEK